MAEELTVYNGSFEQFVSSILEPKHKLTRKETEQAGQLFRGCGSLRRYIAYAICQEYKPERLTVADRDSLTAVCREHLHCNMDYALKLHRQATIEIEAFGPFSTSPHRLEQSMSLECANELARLPEGERKSVYDECVTFEAAQSVAGSPKGFLSNLTHIVNRRLKELNPAPPATGIPATDKVPEVTPNFKPDTKKQSTVVLPPAPEPPKLVDDDEDPADYDAPAILASEAMVPLLVTPATYGMLEDLAKRWNCETVEDYIEWEVARLHAKHCAKMDASDIENVRFRKVGRPKHQEES